MSDERPPSESGGGLTRRSLLAATGVTAVAGCRSLESLGDDGERTISAYDLPDIDPESVPEPIVPPSVPVEIGPTYLTSSRERTTTLLAELPTPLGPDGIPNGYIRRKITDAAENATDGLDEARTARTDLLALQSLRHAREHARYAAAGWAVADSGLSADPLRAAYDRTVSQARSFRNEYEYVGTDPVRAALVHAHIEASLDWVLDGDAPRIRDAGPLLTVAQWGEAAESVRAHLADARYLDEQFRSSLSDDAGTLRGLLTSAAESLFAEVRSQQSDLPPEPTAEDWGPSERVVHELRREVTGEPRSVAEMDGPASAVVDSTDRLAKASALERLAPRVEAGALAGPESARAVREIRTATYDALAGALEDSPATELARSVISDLSWRVTRADRELSRYRGDVSPGRVTDVVTDYVVATAVARATPATCQHTLDVLGTGD